MSHETGRSDAKPGARSRPSWFQAARWRRAIIFAGVLALLAVAPARGCEGGEMRAAAEKQGKRVRAGTWGGPHARLVVGGSGAEIEFDCARGSITGPLGLDSEGRFEAQGTFAREGGPIRLGRTRGGRPARYEGRVSGRTLTLTVTLKETSQTVGTFTLTHGNQGRLWKCR